MKSNGIFYRLIQFRNALYARPASDDIERIRSILTPVQMDLFARMQNSEQVHAITVLEKIIAQADYPHQEIDRDLMVAALLHDVGKSLYPLKSWERALIVIVKALFPAKAKGWGSGPLTMWRKAFVVAEQHPAWGGQLAAQAGASSRVVELIRHHQNLFPTIEVDLDIGLLQRLQAADQES